MSLVKGNKESFTTCEVKQAGIARELHRKLGLLGYGKFFRLLEKNYICNCSITVDDAKKALQIYGPDIALFKGKKPGKEEIKSSSWDISQSQK